MGKKCESSMSPPIHQARERPPPLSLSLHDLSPSISSYQTHPTHRLPGGVPEDKALVVGLGPAVRVELLLHALHLPRHNQSPRAYLLWGRKDEHKRKERARRVRVQSFVSRCMCACMRASGEGGESNPPNRGRCSFARTVVWRSRRMSGMDMVRFECVTPTITTPCIYLVVVSHRGGGGCVVHFNSGARFCVSHPSPGVTSIHAPWAAGRSGSCPPPSGSPLAPVCVMMCRIVWSRSAVDHDIRGGRERVGIANQSLDPSPPHIQPTVHLPGRRGEGGGSGPRARAAGGASPSLILFRI